MKARRVTPVGEVAVEWTVADREFRLHVESPQGVETTILLPDGSSVATGGGVADLGCLLV